MGDIVLLMDAVKQVCHWALGKDRHVFPTVGLVAQGNSGLGLVVVVSCRSEISFECLPEPQCCNRNIPFFLIIPQDWFESPFYRRGSWDSATRGRHFTTWHPHRPGTKRGSPDPWHLPG